MRHFCASWLFNDLELPVAHRRELGAAVFEYIEIFNNRERRHSTLGYLSPEQYENRPIKIKTKKEPT